MGTAEGGGLRCEPTAGTERCAQSPGTCLEGAGKAGSRLVPAKLTDSSF